MLVSRQDGVGVRRRISRVAAGIVLVAASVGACATPTEVNKPGTEPGPNDQRFWITGYHAYWMNDAWEAYDLSVLRKIMFFDVTVAADGSLEERNGWPDNWEPLARHVRKAGGAIVPTVTVLDPETFRHVFGRPEAANRLREELLALMKEAPADGLHLDFEMFESVSPYVRRSFTTFVADLRRDLRAYNPDIYLTLFALAFDDHDVYDERALAEHLDYFIVQGYDLHWLGDREAGPVAALQGWNRRNWKFVVDRFLGQDVPRKKIVMGIPYFGYEWPTTDGEPGASTRGPGTYMTYAPLAGDKAGELASARERAEAYGLRRDPVSGSPYYAYEDSTGWHQGWFEDAVSLKAKYEYVRAHDLGGVAIFPLGYGDVSLDRALRDVFGQTASLASR